MLLLACDIETPVHATAIHDREITCKLLQLHAQDVVSRAYMGDVPRLTRSAYPPHNISRRRHLPLAWWSV